jgi:hypothetical protein
VLDVLKEDPDTPYSVYLSAAEETLDAISANDRFSLKPVSSGGVGRCVYKLLDFASREIKEFIDCRR